jgi:3'-phosphoadenosine 5'-phosphosulfate sulfotransferase (PAPS reductase)/FAD synthetase
MYHVPLMTLRTPENIEDITADHGLYGPAKHGDIFQKLKGRQIDHLARRYESSHWFWAVREAESDKRAEKMQRGYGDSTRKYDEERSLQNGTRDVWHHAPYRHLSDAEVFERAKALKIPPNPLWFKETPSDCGCGATAKFWEREEARQAGLEWLAEKIEELEEIARENGHTSGRCHWGEMKAQYKRALNDGQQTLAGDDVERADLASMACGIGTDCQKSSVPVTSAKEYVKEVFA